MAGGGTPDNSFTFVIEDATGPAAAAQPIPPQPSAAPGAAPEIEGAKVSDPALAPPLVPVPLAPPRPAATPDFPKELAEPLKDIAKQLHQGGVLKEVPAADEPSHLPAAEHAEPPRSWSQLAEQADRWQARSPAPQSPLEAPHEATGASPPKVGSQPAPAEQAPPKSLWRELLGQVGQWRAQVLGAHQAPPASQNEAAQESRPKAGTKKARPKQHEMPSPAGQRPAPREQKRDVAPVRPRLPEREEAGDRIASVTKESDLLQEQNKALGERQETETAISLLLKRRQQEDEQAHRRRDPVAEAKELLRLIEKRNQLLREGERAGSPEAKARQRSRGERSDDDDDDDDRASGSGRQRAETRRHERFRVRKRSGEEEEEGAVAESTPVKNIPRPAAKTGGAAVAEEAPAAAGAAKAGSGMAAAEAGGAAAEAGGAVAAAGGIGAAASAVLGPIGVAVGTAVIAIDVFAGAVSTAANILTPIARGNNFEGLMRAADTAAGALGPLAPVAHAVIGAFRQVAVLIDAVVARGRELSRYSPTLSMATARADIRKMQADMREAQETGPAMARLIDAQSRASAALNDALMPIKKFLIETLANVMEEIADWFDEHAEDIAANLEAAVTLLEAIAQAVTLHIPTAVEILEEMPERIQKAREAASKRKTNQGVGLQLLFNLMNPNQNVPAGSTDDSLAGLLHQQLGDGGGGGFGGVGGGF